MKNLAFISCICLLLTGCEKIDLFEKNIPIPDHSWSSQFKPSVEFDITDTVSAFRLYIVIRHSDAYRYKNLWVNLISQPPGDSANTQRINLVLGNDEKGWLGKGMDDIIEHRILLNPSGSRFIKTGRHRFTLQQIMREDPLEHIFNAGIRLEKVLN